jgi:hypothetical protein
MRLRCSSRTSIVEGALRPVAQRVAECASDCLHLDLGHHVVVEVPRDMKAYSGRDPGGSERPRERLIKISERATSSPGSSRRIGM